MKPKQMMLFAVAIGCGLVAMIGAQTVLSGNRPPEQEMVKILVAKVDIEPGTALDKSNVDYRDWPKDNVPEGAISKDEQYVEHASKIRLNPNMPVLMQYLAGKGQVGVLSLIPKGMTMVTLPADSTGTHSGMLRAGSYVMVTCAINRPSRDGSGRETVQIKTVMKRAKVIAVQDKLAGTDSAKEGNSGKVENISLLVFPKQANLLMLARNASREKMYFTLLGEEDRSKDDTRDLDEVALEQAKNDLLGDSGVDRTSNLPRSAQVPAADAEKATGSSLSDYLKQQQIAPEVIDLGKRPSKATWRIEIWNKDKRDIHEIELADEPATTPSAAPPVSNQWTSPLMQFFSRKRNRKAQTQETQTSPLDDVSPESSNDKSAASPVDTARQ